MKALSLLTIILLSFTGISQNISGVAYYESKTTVDMDNFGNREMSEDMKRQIMDRMKNYLEKTYILTFNGNESIYKEQEKLEAGAGRGGFAMMMGSFSAGKQYKNIKNNQILEEREFFGKEFLINDTLTNLDWEITKESKQIGQYLAIKATAIKPIDENDFSMARRRNRDRDRDTDKKEDEETEGEKAVDSTNNEPRDPFDEIEIPKTVQVTAWFTPQIPVGNGPGEYAGLPGLILELNAYRTTLLCSKIVLNPEDADVIEAPNKGKEVTREEYNKIVKEKMDEMRENFRGRGGRRGGRRFGG
ncbi:MAG: GLPGLI family protein [Bacteroidia bacterium]|nr:GLPGLI family protein [Bacteroidia bacterium]NNF29812.1 GLPGLI family protein [Flavobacteriaceae bacterium]MBT8275988.1 GLPGLI family protein [Bacteroidia bacterium]NNJ80814.1 GLPGLI family protein [Flavobacteriaceae bacterium]NNK55354.1 GLPGLI family protein [Flavobacteriaceae bacterium]